MPVTLNDQQLVSQAEDQMLRNRLLDMINCMHGHLYSMHFAYMYNTLYTTCISIYNSAYFTDTPDLTCSTFMCQ